MRHILQRTACLAFMLALPLTFSQPSLAQQANPIPPSPPQNTGSPQTGEDEYPQRQQMREEMQQIRSEHEALEQERDTLKTQCMNVKGQDHTTCQAQFQNLHQRQEALHERMKALHEKMEAMRGPNGGGMWPQNNQNHAMNLQGQNGTPPTTNIQNATAGAPPSPPTGSMQGVASGATPGELPPGPPPSAQ